MATKKAKTPEPAEPSKSKNLRITASPGKTHDRLLAEIAADGLATGACLLVDFGKGAYGELSLADAVRVIDDTAKAVHGGNLKGAETMLTAQAAALNAIFGELARRSAMNMGATSARQKPTCGWRSRPRASVGPPLRHWPPSRTRRRCSPVRPTSTTAGSCR